jgi:nitrite reductase/ring-hydroxylating ferredoxin subunit
MTRFEFLKTAGFTGGSLFALLTGCVQESDKYIAADALDANGQVIKPNTTTGTTPNTGTSTTTSTTATGSADASFFVKTSDLNAIKALKTINLSSPSAVKLSKRNGYIVVDNSYVVALSKDGKYLAATVLCTHEPKRKVIYLNDEWYCTDHEARFTLAGKGLNKNGSKGLSIFKTATDGKTLVVY